MDDIKNMVFDEFGNLITEYEIIQYDKRANDEWVEDRRFESGRSYFIINDKIYYKCSNSLIELNMDFESKSCGACYKVAGIIEDGIKIIGNEILFKESVELENGYSLSLHKQSYSDGSCFYTLEDKNGKWSVNHGSNNINDLIEQMELEKSISMEHRNTSNHEISCIDDVMIKFYEAIITRLSNIA